MSTSTSAKLLNLFAAAILVGLSASTALAATPTYEEPPISYGATAPNDPVSRLNDAIASGKTKLTNDNERGRLEALLRELKIPASSQTLVFSKTSFQRNRISPQQPRAIYFNDDTYVGYIPGGDVIEIASTDPKLGSTFYTVEQDAPDASVKFVRQTDSCLQCHGESMTRGIPGLLVRSVFADASGEAILPAGTFITTHESPLAERWGGWYVTGSTGKQPHMGNTRWRAQQGQQAPVPLDAPARNSKQLPAGVDVSDYLTPHSDVVALMVLEHQVEAHNRLTRAAHGTLRALRDEKIMNDAFGEPTKPGVHSESTLARIKSSCEPLVEYFLFAGETPLTDRVEGSSPFAKEFAAREPRDAHGRSLREFDLKTRLFRYPCSYLIYSEAMDGLPDPAKEYIYRRLWEVLGGKDTSKAFAHLSADDRAAILEILRETKPAARDAWSKLESARQ